MAQTEDVLASLEMMRENLLETLKETSMLRHVAMEEEGLIGAENIDNTCNNALRHMRQIRHLLGPRNYGTAEDADSKLSTGRRLAAVESG